MDAPALALAEGHEADEAGWRAAAASVLRKAGRLGADAPDTQVLDLLARHTVEGLTIPALGTPQASSRIHPGPVGAAPFTRGRERPAGWDIRALIADDDPTAAAGAALDDLQGGATSLWLRVGPAGTAPADLATVLADVRLDLAPVVLEPTGTVTVTDVTAAFGAVLRERNPVAGTSLGVDPVGQAFRVGTQAPQTALLDDVTSAARLATALRVGAIIVDGTAVHDAGAGDALELGYSLAVAACYLRALERAGIAPDVAAGLIGFRYSATDEQFPTIAKFRAARQLWSRVLELSGLEPAEQVQHAVTSAAMLTRYDPWTNLLRTTVAAFAAGTGGAAAVTVLPFDSALGVPDALGRRLARNISHLLISESHAAAVADPAGGAHAIELLTGTTAEAAWAEFGRIEAAGGVLAALDDVRARAAATGRSRTRDLATRKRPVTGVSEFPLAGEELPARRAAPPRSGLIRWAEPFETLRDNPADKPVYLALIGTPATHTARAVFTRNALTAIGVTAVDSPVEASSAELADAFARSGCTVVVLAGSDAGYAAHAAELARSLRAAGATRIILAGRPSAAMSGLVDDHLAVGEDVLAFAARIREHLGEHR